MIMKCIEFKEEIEESRIEILERKWEWLFIFCLIIGFGQTTQETGTH